MMNEALTEAKKNLDMLYTTRDEVAWWKQSTKL
jgi:hypothetical protein